MIGSRRRALRSEASRPVAVAAAGKRWSGALCALVSVCRAGGCMLPQHVGPVFPAAILVSGCPPDLTANSHLIGTATATHVISVTYHRHCCCCCHLGAQGTTCTCRLRWRRWDQTRQ
eukprot:COSAG01_NODE_6653_length_3562_cov_2.222062_3_plen_117_part_00